MVVRLVGPPKLAGVHGYRWTVSRLTSAVPPGARLGARGFGLAAEAAKQAGRRFGCHPLGEVDLLAAWQAGKPFGEGNAISIEGIAGKPLLVFDASYIFRRTFDAACRLAKV